MLVPEKQKKLTINLPNQTKSLPYGALFALASAYFMVGTASLVVVGLADPIMGELQISPPFIGYLVSIFAISFAVTAPIAISVFGDFPRVHLLLTGLVLMACSLGLGATSASYGMLFLSRFLLAIGAAVVSPVCAAVASSIVPPEHQGKALALSFSGLTISTVVGVPLASLAGTLFDWRLVFWVLALLCLLTALLVKYSVSDRSAGGRLPLFAMVETIFSPAKVSALGTTLTQMAAQFITYALIAIYLVEQFDIPPTSVSIALMLFGVGGVAGNLIASQLIDRIGGRRLYRISTIGMGASLLILWLFTGQAIIGFLSLLFWPVFGMMFQPAQQQKMGRLDPERQNLMFSLNASFLYLGMSLGSWFGSVLYDVIGSVWLPLASLSVLVVSYGLNFWSEQAEDQVSSAETSE